VADFAWTFSELVGGAAVSFDSSDFLTFFLITFFVFGGELGADTVAFVRVSEPAGVFSSAFTPVAVAGLSLGLITFGCWALTSFVIVGLSVNKDLVGDLSGGEGMCTFDAALIGDLGGDEERFAFAIVLTGDLGGDDGQLAFTADFGGEEAMLALGLIPATANGLMVIGAASLKGLEPEFFLLKNMTSSSGSSLNDGFRTVGLWNSFGCLKEGFSSLGFSSTAAFDVVGFWAGVLGVVNTSFSSVF
jgi:hypothetical protein